MKFLDGSTIICAPGELIKLNIQPINTVHNVNYVLEDEAGTLVVDDPLHFRIDRSSLLLMDFAFSENAGGMYRVEIAGEKGGATAFTIRQPLEEAIASRQITFSLEGDHTTKFPIG
jgi:hypothetical protein